MEKVICPFLNDEPVDLIYIYPKNFSSLPGMKFFGLLMLSYSRTHNPKIINAINSLAPGWGEYLTSQYGDQLTSEGKLLPYGFIDDPQNIVNIMRVISLIGANENKVKEMIK